WEYHQKLFASQDLSSDKLKAMAKEVGLDAAKFDECLTKTPYAKTIDKDVADGSEAGVNGTPAFFINGRMLSGAQPFEKFKEIIADRPRRTGPPKSGGAAPPRAAARARRRHGEVRPVNAPYQYLVVSDLHLRGGHADHTAGLYHFDEEFADFLRYYRLHRSAA